MWCLLPFAALLLLSIIPTTAEVVRSMLDCTGFLLQETPPRVPGILEGGNILDQNRYKPICQTFSNLRSFMTLYDTTNRIPVFSASKYSGSQGGRPQTSWNIEPQVGLFSFLTYFITDLSASLTWLSHYYSLRTQGATRTCSDHTETSSTSIRLVNVITEIIPSASIEGIYFQALMDILKMIRYLHLP